jgi:hypothetical protein
VNRGRHPATPAPAIKDMDIAGHHIPASALTIALALVIAAVLVFVIRRVAARLPRRQGHLRRLAYSALVAALVSAAAVGYVDHTRHAKVVSRIRPGNQAGNIATGLFHQWLGLFIVATVLFFAVATLAARWWYRRRSAGALGGLTRRRGRRRSPVESYAGAWPGGGPFDREYEEF